MNFKNHRNHKTWYWKAVLSVLLFTATCSEAAVTLTQNGNDWIVSNGMVRMTLAYSGSYYRENYEAFNGSSWKGVLQEPAT